jgi:hypothetical protein
MGKRVIPSKTILVGPYLVTVIRDLRRRYTVYLDIGGSAHRVLGLLVPSHVRVMRRAAAPARDLDFTIKVLADNFQNGEQFCIYGVKSAPTLTSEFTTTEVS